MVLGDLDPIERGYLQEFKIWKQNFDLGLIMACENLSTGQIFKN